MSELDEENIKHLVRLSRIRCSDEEQKRMLADLGKILDYVKELQEVDTSHVAPCSHVLEDLTAYLRDDIPGETMPREVLMANAPDSIGGMIRVPKVLKSN